MQPDFVDVLYFILKIDSRTLEVADMAIITYLKRRAEFAGTTLPGSTDWARLVTFQCRITQKSIFAILPNATV